MARAQKEKGKEDKVKTKGKDDRDKFDPKSSSNKFKKCFYCDKVGHVRADCRKKKRGTEQFELIERVNESTRTHKHHNEHFWGQFVVSPTAHHSLICLG